MFVGLVPAAIVGWFAYNANDDYRKKQILIVSKTAEAISVSRQPSVLQQKSKAADDGARRNSAARRR